MLVVTEEWKPRWSLPRIDATLLVARDLSDAIGLRRCDGPSFHGCHFALVVSLTHIPPRRYRLSQETWQPSNIEQQTKAMCEVLHITPGFFCVGA